MQGYFEVEHRDGAHYSQRILDFANRISSLINILLLGLKESGVSNINNGENIF